MVRAAAVTAVAFVLSAGSVWAATPAPPVLTSDYDSGDVYWVRGNDKQAIHGMQEAWVFNRAMVWLDEDDGVEGAVLCYSNQNPLPLTGRKQVSRWFAGKTNDLADADDAFTRFVKKDATRAVDHVSLPPFQFHLGQHPVAEVEVREATHPWQLLVAVKGRSGPPLYASAWKQGAGKLSVNLLELFRGRGDKRCFAELHFAIATWTDDPKSHARVVFRLRLSSRAAIVASLPVIRTAERAKREGVPVYAVVLDENARRLGPDAVSVSASAGRKAFELSGVGNGIWKGVVRGLAPGDHKATLRAAWKDGQRTATTTLSLRITGGQFVGYDPKLRLLTRSRKPLGPLTGSYRGQAVFKGIGAPRESLLHGQEQWDAAIADRDRPDYGFHWWESLTERELDADYAYLARCGWSLIHLCQGWLWWERFDAGGRLAPHAAEQLARVCAAARRHGLHVHVALSHYPLGRKSAPYAQYLEAGYRRSDYRKPDSKFYTMFADYLRQFATVFRDETALSSFTAAGEGDPGCGMAFINMVHDTLQARDGNHLVLCEPHHQITRHPSYYRQAGWKPLLGGMRTYGIDRHPPEAIGVQFKLSAMGDVFMGEGTFYGFLGGRHQYMNVEMPMDSYRRRVRETIYTGLAYRNPILLTWEERVVEDERVVFEQVRRAVDWSKPFQTPRLAVRVHRKLMPIRGRGRLFRLEKQLASFPLEYAYVWEDDPVPDGTLFTLDAREALAEPGFVSDGGRLPDALKAEMPLRLPAGFAANYSWSQDHRTLLAFIRDASAPEPTGGATEAGHYTYADTTRVIDRDTPIDTWQVQCVKPGAIQMRVYRREGDAVVLVGRSETVEMKKVGRNRFSLKKPIAARKGDFIGFYIRSEATHIAASHGGHMLYFEGTVPQARTPLSKWKTERKMARISAFNAAEAAKPKPMPPRPAPGIVLQHFPPGKLSYRLFDLAAKQAVLEGHFERNASLAPPRGSRHLFLVVTEP